MNERWWRYPLVRELGLVLLVKLALVWGLYRLFFADPVIAVATPETEAASRMATQLGIPKVLSVPGGASVAVPAGLSVAPVAGSVASRASGAEATGSDTSISNNVISSPVVPSQAESHHDQ